MFKTVLSIEDDKFTQQLNEIYFKETGFCKQMIKATSGSTALQFFERIENGEEPIENLPQIIFLDLNMPVMGGWEFLNQFELQFPQYAKGMPILILTSSVNPDDKIKAIDDSRVICLLEKPFDFEQIEIAKKLLSKVK